MRKAFTLIEIMVVIALISVMATIILPRLKQRKPNTEWPSITQEINNLIFLARQEAIANGKVHRLTFKSQPPKLDLIVVEEETVNAKKPEQRDFKEITSFYAKTHYELPEGIRINGVYLNKKDMLPDNKNQGYCYIVPDGLVQDVWIRLTRHLDGKESKATLKVMPFAGECIYVDGHEKPV